MLTVRNIGSLVCLTLGGNVRR